jgi:hypothetical protein
MESLPKLSRGTGELLMGLNKQACPLTEGEQAGRDESSDDERKNPRNDRLEEQHPVGAHAHALQHANPHLRSHLQPNKQSIFDT